MGRTPSRTGALNRSTARWGGSAVLGFGREKTSVLGSSLTTVAAWGASVVVSSIAAWFVARRIGRGSRPRHGTSACTSPSCTLILASQPPHPVLHVDANVADFVGVAPEVLQDRPLAWLDDLPPRRADVIRQFLASEPLHVVCEHPFVADEMLEVRTIPVAVGEENAAQIVVTFSRYAPSAEKAGDDDRPRRDTGDDLAQLAFMSSFSGGVVIATDDGAVYVNDVLSDLTGYSREDLLQWDARRLLRSVHPADRAAVANVIRMARSGRLEGRQRYEFRITSASGEERWIVLHARVYSVGGVPHFGAVMHNIDKHKHTEAELRVVQERLLSYLESADDLAYFYGVDGRTTFLNDAVTRLTGFSREELEQDPGLWDSMLSCGERRAIAGVSDSEDGSGSHEVEYSLTCKDGSTCWFQSRMVPVDDDSGRLAGFSCVDRDITRLKTAEEEIKRHGEMYARTIEAISHPFCVIDVATRKVMTANDAAGVGDRVGVITCHELFHDRSTPCGDGDEPCPIAMVARTREPVTVEHLHRETGGRSSIQEVHVYPVLDEQNNAREAIYYAHDVTKEVKYERARSVLLNISRAASTCTSLRELLPAIREHLAIVIDTDNFFIALYDDATETYTVPFIADEYYTGESVPTENLRNGVTDYVRRTGESLLIGAEQFQELVDRGEVALVGEPSPIWMGVPLKTSRGVIGVVGIQDYEDPEAFGEQDLELMTLVSGNIALVIERQRSEDALRESRRNYENLYSRALVGLARLRVSDGAVLECNDRAARLFGYPSRRDFIASGRAAEFCASSDDWVSFAGQLSRSGELEDCEARLRRKDGSFFWARYSAQASPDLDIIDMAFTDVSEAKEAIEAQRRLAAAVQQAGEMIIITDGAGVIEYVNPSFQEISGFTSSQVTGLHISDPGWGSFDRESFEEIWEQVSSGLVWSGHYSGVKTDETEYDGEAMLSPVRDERGRIANYIMVIRDVTRQTNLENQLRQAIKMEAVGRLAGGIAHDFNNMLTGIVVNTEMLQMDLPEDSDLMPYLDEIARTAELATRLTRQLLTFSKRGSSKPEVLDIRRVLDNVGRLLRPIIGEDVDLEVDCGPGELRVKIDASYLEQVIMNLAVNARDAMPGGGSLLIETRLVELDEAYAREHAEVEAGWYVMVGVSDTGIGMDAITQARIFEPFFSTKGDAGTGLGLATVYGIVRQAGGHIHLYSEPGSGTTFRVYLPWMDSPVPEDRAPLAGCEGASDRNHETILVVEDEESIRHVLVDLLTRSGYRVYSAPTAEEAIGTASGLDGPIHLLLTDVVLPGMNGRELAESLTDERPDMRVLYTSGYNENVISRHGVLEPGIAFIQKPYNVRDLLRIVRGELDALPSPDS